MNNKIINQIRNEMKKKMCKLKLIFARDAQKLSFI